MTFGVNVSWHDTNLAFTWFYDTWAVGSDETGLRLSLKHGLNSDHVECRDTFSNADYEFNLCFDGLLYGIGRERSRNIDN